MKFKKIQSLFLVITLLVSFILTGCQSTKEVGAANEAEMNNTTGLIWYMIGTPQPDQKRVMKAVNEYTASKIGVTLDLRMIDWSEYDKKMQTIISSGDRFDICFASEYPLNAQKGAFLELTDLLDDYGKGIKESIDARFLEGARINGGLYGIPANKEIGQQMVWMFNEDMAKDAGVYEDMKSAKSLEDLEPILEKVKAKNPSLKMPIAIGSKFFPYMPYDMLLGETLPFAVNLEGDTTKIVNIYEQDHTKQVLNTIRRFYNKGLINFQAASYTDSHKLSNKDWFVRKAQYAPGAKETWSLDAGYDIDYTEIHKPLIINNSITGSIMSISSTSPNPKKAMEFLNLLNTDEYLRNLVDRGIEGIHYTTNDDKTIKETQSSSLYKVPSWALGNVFILKTYDKEAKDKIKQYEEFNKKSIPSPTLGFYVDTSNIKTEIAVISNIMSEYKPALFTGSVDIEKYLKQLNTKLDEAGIDNVIKEIQSQYDKWMRENI